MKDSLHASILETARACADIARTTITPHFRADLRTGVKSDDSPVTEADHAAERAMRALIHSAHPEHGILGEEGGVSGETSEWLWVLDPIDGTRAFLTGRPTFGTLIALFHEGRPVLGIIDQPITKERWIGVAGRRTVYEAETFPGTVGTRTGITLAEAELSCTAPEIMTPAHLTRFQTLQRNTRRTSWGGDCYAYGLLALGKIDVIAECTMKPWDWGALVPVIEGAGGRVTDWQGNTLTLESDGSILAVGDPALVGCAVRYLSRSVKIR